MSQTRGRSFLGEGDYVSIAKAYRRMAQEKGWLVTLRKKAERNPEVVKLLGASNFKLWSCLTRLMDYRMREELVQVNWTFNEAAEVAEHLRRDLGIEKALFIIGGWIHRGYDNQHPDILPAAPECGGNEGLAKASKRVRDLGYLFCLHDKYQDIYRDSPSWSEDLIMKGADGQLVKGGFWAGGQAWLVCSKMGLEMARRNMPEVKALFNPNAYFVDTTTASPLFECYDEKHPLTKWDDMEYKQRLLEYTASVFGISGSECGREWAVPYSHFFEGLVGVSGRYYHALNPESIGAKVIPLFEMVYRDCVAAYGRYGYDPSEAAEYVLTTSLWGDRCTTTSSISLAEEHIGRMRLKMSRRDTRLVQAALLGRMEDGLKDYACWTDSLKTPMRYCHRYTRSQPKNSSQNMNF
ncbi:MAG: DUF5696 domain-containing protein [Candidatus Bathyarchaeia archaeon]